MDSSHRKRTLLSLASALKLCVLPALRTVANFDVILVPDDLYQGVTAAGDAHQIDLLAHANLLTFRVARHLGLSRRNFGRQTRDSQSRQVTIQQLPRPQIFYFTRPLIRRITGERHDPSPSNYCILVYLNENLFVHIKIKKYQIQVKRSSNKRVTRNKRRQKE